MKKSAIKELWDEAPKIAKMFFLAIGALIVFMILSMSCERKSVVEARPFVFKSLKIEINPFVQDQSIQCPHCSEEIILHSQWKFSLSDI